MTNYSPIYNVLKQILILFGLEKDIQLYSYDSDFEILWEINGNNKLSFDKNIWWIVDDHPAPVPWVPLAIWARYYRAKYYNLNHLPNFIIIGTTDNIQPKRVPNQIYIPDFYQDSGIRNLLFSIDDFLYQLLRPFPEKTAIEPDIVRNDIIDAWKGLLYSVMVAPGSRHAISNEIAPLLLQDGFNKFKNKYGDNQIITNRINECLNNIAMQKENKAILQLWYWVSDFIPSEHRPIPEPVDLDKIKINDIWDCWSKGYFLLIDDQAKSHHYDKLVECAVKLVAGDEINFHSMTGIDIDQVGLNRLQEIFTKNNNDIPKPEDILNRHRTNNVNKNKGRFIDILMDIQNSVANYLSDYIVKNQYFMDNKDVCNFTNYLLNRIYNEILLFNKIYEFIKLIKNHTLSEDELKSEIKNRLMDKLVLLELVQYDCIILDLRLIETDLISRNYKNISGLRLVDKISQMDKYLPIIIFTSSQQREIENYLAIYKNVILLFRKPGIAGSVYSLEGIEAVNKLINAVRLSLEMMENRLVYRKITTLDGKTIKLNYNLGHEVTDGIVIKPTNEFRELYKKVFINRQYDYAFHYPYSFLDDIFENQHNDLIKIESIGISKNPSSTKPLTIIDGDIKSNGNQSLSTRIILKNAASVTYQDFQIVQSSPDLSLYFCVLKKIRNFASHQIRDFDGYRHEAIVTLLLFFDTINMNSAEHQNNPVYNDLGQSECLVKKRKNNTIIVYHPLIKYPHKKSKGYIKKLFNAFLYYSGNNSDTNKKIYQLLESYQKRQ